LKLMALVSEDQLEQVKVGEFDKLVDSLWLCGMSSTDKALWRNVVERLANDFICDAVVELPTADAHTLSELADTACKWQPKLIPQFPMTRDGLLACKNFSSAGFKVALKVNEIWQVAISLKVRPTLLRLPTSTALGATKGILTESAQLLSSVLRAFEGACEKEHPIHIILEAASHDELPIALTTVAFASGLLLPFSLLSNTLT